jgi:hypothetical protein
VPQVMYRVEGDDVRFSERAVKLRLGGYWIMAANRTVTLAQFEHIIRENPHVEFVADRPGERPGAEPTVA